MIRVIQPPCDLTTQLLPRFNRLGEMEHDTLRPLYYLIGEEDEEGVSILNLITKELLHVKGINSIDDFSALPVKVIDILADKLFLVPEQFDEYELTKQLKDILRISRKKSESITNFTILTTTGCNARCSYCCESGIVPVSMSTDSAEAVGSYVTRKGNPQGVKLTWFGGEPLINVPAIRRITRILSEERISFQSSMISNGLLFSEAVIDEAVKDWNLNHVQITLDGTEQTHNQRKAFKNTFVSAFRVIIRNIEMLLARGVRVAVRMNLDESNFEDVKSLADYLYEIFGDDDRFSAYSFPIFQSITPALIDKWIPFERRVLSILGDKSATLPRSLPDSSCMADDGSSIVIMPDGKTCLCEQLCQSSYVGDVFSDKSDQDVARLWEERIKETGKCVRCPIYPDCNQLLLCPSSKHGCNPSYREGKIVQLNHLIKSHTLKVNDDGQLRPSQ